MFHVKHILNSLTPARARATTLALGDFSECKRGSTSSSWAAAMPAVKRRPRPRAWARRPRWSHISSRPSARCRAIPRSAVWARATWSARSMRSTALWAGSPTAAEFSSECSTGARVRRCAGRAPRRTASAMPPPCRTPIAATENLTVIEGEADDLIVSGGAVAGLRLKDGRELTAGAVVLTTGTFLRGLIHIGEKQTPAGRVGEAPAIGLSLTLERHRLCPRSAQDRYAAADRRHHHRLGCAGNAARRRAAGAVLGPDRADR